MIWLYMLWCIFFHGSSVDNPCLKRFCRFERELEKRAASAERTEP